MRTGEGASPQAFGIRGAVLFMLLVFAATASAQEAGRKVFTGKGNCFACHGGNAKGTPLAPDLTDNVWLNVDGSVEQIAEVVKAGVPKPKKYPAPMPPMGGAKLSVDEVAAVAKYVASLAPAQAKEKAGQR